MAVLPRPSGLIGRLPVPTAVEYSLISRYSGFLYHTSHDGRRIVAVEKSEDFLYVDEGAKARRQEEEEECRPR